MVHGYMEKNDIKMKMRWNNKGIFIENRHVSIKLKKRGGNFMPRVAMVVKPDFTSESVVDVKPRQEYTSDYREVLFKINL